MTNSKQNTYEKRVHEALKQQILKQNTYKTVHEALMQQILKQNTYKIVNEALT